MAADGKFTGKIPVFDKTKGLEMYFKDVVAWDSITNIAKKKRAITLILEIDEEIRSQIFDKFTNDELLHDNGIDRYLQYLKDTYGKDDCVSNFQNPGNQ